MLLNQSILINILENNSGCLIIDDKSNPCVLLLHLRSLTYADLFCFLDSSRGHFQNAYDLVYLEALKSSLLNKLHIFQRMGKIFCLKCGKLKNFQIYELVFLKRPC